ncbi:MAG: transposase [Caballeronia mineralivorans]|nr:transposase [Caballeronia mineralivorans]
MKACAGVQHWARWLIGMGHQVKLVPGKSVKAFNIGNKNDAADAPATGEVPLNVDEQFARLAHRIRRSDEYAHDRQRTDEMCPRNPSDRR